MKVVPVPVAVRSKAYVFDRLIVGIADSNPAVGMDVYCVGSGLCGEMITHSVDTCWACASVCDLYTSKTRGLGPIWAVVPQEKLQYFEK